MVLKKRIVRTFFSERVTGCYLWNRRLAANADYARKSISIPLTGTRADGVHISRLRSGLGNGNRPKRRKNRHGVCNTGIRLLLKRDFKGGDDDSVSSSVGHKFFDSVFKSDPDIKCDRIGIQYIMLNRYVGRHSTARCDRDYTIWNIAMAQGRETKLIGSNRPEVGIVRDAKCIARR